MRVCSFLQVVSLHRPNAGNCVRLLRSHIALMKNRERGETSDT